MMKCDDIAAYWERSPGSGLPFPESSQLAAHLRECPRCRQAFEWDSASLAALAKIPEIEPGREFIAGICLRISRGEMKENSPLMDYLKSSLEITLAGAATLTLWALFNEEIIGFARISMLAFDKLQGRILSLFEKVFPDAEKVNEAAHRSAELAGQFPWALIAGIVFFLVFVTYVGDLFRDEQN